MNGQYPGAFEQAPAVSGIHVEWKRPVLKSMAEGEQTAGDPGGSGNQQGGRRKSLMREKRKRIGMRQQEVERNRA